MASKGPEKKKAGLLGMFAKSKAKDPVIDPAAQAALEAQRSLEFEQLFGPVSTWQALNKMNGVNNTLSALKRNYIRTGDFSEFDKTLQDYQKTVTRVAEGKEPYSLVTQADLDAVNDLVRKAIERQKLSSLNCKDYIFSQTKVAYVPPVTYADKKINTEAEQKRFIADIANYGNITKTLDVLDKHLSDLKSNKTISYNINLEFATSVQQFIITHQAELEVRILKEQMEKQQMVISPADFAFQKIEVQPSARDMNQEVEQIRFIKDMLNYHTLDKSISVLQDKLNTDADKNTTKYPGFNISLAYAQTLLDCISQHKSTFEFLKQNEAAAKQEVKAGIRHK